jgi:hypothetical protein
MAMGGKNWLVRIRTIDVRLIAAVAASLLLIVGVMWTVPTTPESNSFTFDSARRNLSNARPIEINKPIPGEIVDGSDIDYYQIRSGAGGHLRIHVQKDSGTLVPALDVYDAARKIIEEKLGPDYGFSGQPNTTYYIQVWGQRNTIGQYTVTVNDSAEVQ